MVKIRLNKPEFEYDVYSLVKAFYTTEELDMKVIAKEAESEDKNADFKAAIFVCYEDTAVTVTMEKDGKITEKQESFDIVNRKEAKNRLKICIYELLSEALKKVLPWGTLTGIRPVKIPRSLYEQGISEVEIYSYMKTKYRASDNKIELSMQIAKKEIEILNKIECQNGYSVYIGIPFCPTTCLYCSFTSYPFSLWEKRADEYLDALEKEIQAAAKMMSHKKPDTIYIGGGTPTSLTPKQLDRLLCMIITYFPTNQLKEFTVEAGRPDSITKEKLDVLRRYPITRISINPQTMKDETLRLIGRHHTAQQTIEAFYLARECGFDNINMDLIVGLPEETIEDIKNTMEELKKLDPDSITVHSLAVKRAARLNTEKENYQNLKISNTPEMIALTARYAKKMGHVPYYLYRQKNMAGNFENVGYAKPDKAGIYNILIMEEKQTILALGAGASTKIVSENGEKIERVENVKDVGIYIERIDEMINRKSEKQQAY